MDATVLITGATGGLGRSVAESFTADGWRVVAPTRSRSTQPSEPDVDFPQADLSDAAAVRRVVEMAASDTSVPLRALVNLIGGYAGGARVQETPIEDFERQFTLNLRPTYLPSEAISGAAIPVYGRA